MLNTRLAGDHKYGKLLFTWLSLVMSFMMSFVLSFSHGMSSRFEKDPLKLCEKLITQTSYPIM